MLGLDVGSQSWVIFKRISLEEARKIIEQNKKYVCAIREEKYAKALSEALGIKLRKCKKRNLHIEIGDEMLVFTVKTSKTASYDKIKQAIENGGLKIYHVRR